MSINLFKEKLRINNLKGATQCRGFFITSLTIKEGERVVKEWEHRATKRTPLTLGPDGLLETLFGETL